MEGELAELLRNPIAGLGFGGLLGAAVGYTLKKVTKLAALVVGVLFVALQGLAYLGFIEIDWHALRQAAESAWIGADGATLAERGWEVLRANLPFGGGFVAGLAAGLRWG